MRQAAIIFLLTGALLLGLTLWLYARIEERNHRTRQHAYLVANGFLPREIATGIELTTVQTGQRPPTDMAECIQWLIDNDCAEMQRQRGLDADRNVVCDSLGVPLTMRIDGDIVTVIAAGPDKRPGTSDDLTATADIAGALRMAKESQSSEGRAPG